MRTNIDWLSFTFPVGQGGYPELGWRWDDIAAAATEYLGQDLVSYLAQCQWTEEGGRKPYAHSQRAAEQGISVFWSGRQSHALIEISGIGMAALRAAGVEREMLAAAQERATRLDIATDIETTTKPAEFAAKRDVARFKAHGSFTSKSGETEYVGSRTSERFARVYRYAEPHPRSSLLRVEHELKKGAAKSAIAHILGYSVEWVQTSLGDTFGWTHSDWRPKEQHVSSIPSLPNSRTAAKTEIWLRSQAAPAFKKLVRLGLITDPEQWLKDVFLDDDNPHSKQGRLFDD